MTPEDLLDLMFPGHIATGLVAFSALETNGSSVQIPYDQNALKDALDRLPKDILAADVNDILRNLKRLAPQETARFMTAALELYFSAPQVVSALRNGQKTLFPNPKTLPEIDPDLLAPVWERHIKGDYSDQ